MKTDVRAFSFYATDTNIKGHVYANSAGRARHLIVYSANDAGWRTKYSDVKIRRAKHLDGKYDREFVTDSLSRLEEE